MLLFIITFSLIVFPYYSKFLAIFIFDNLYDFSVTMAKHKQSNSLCF